MKKVFITIAALVLLAVSAAIIYNLCAPKKYVIYDINNMVILKTNDIYEYFQTEKGLSEKNIIYTTVYN